MHKGFKALGQVRIKRVKYLSARLCSSVVPTSRIVYVNRRFSYDSLIHKRSKELTHRGEHNVSYCIRGILAFLNSLITLVHSTVHKSS